MSQLLGMQLFKYTKVVKCTQEICSSWSRERKEKFTGKFHCTFMCHRTHNIIHFATGRDECSEQTHVHLDDRIKNIQATWTLLRLSHWRRDNLCIRCTRLVRRRERMKTILFTFKCTLVNKRVGEMQFIEFNCKPWGSKVYHYALMKRC